MKKDKNMNMPLEGLPDGRELRVERRFVSERKTYDMLKSLIRAHTEPA